MIIVMRGAKLRQQLITFERTVIQDELEIIGNKLNDVFSGLGVADIKAKEVELSPEEKQVTECLVEIMRSEEEMEYDEPRLDGLHFALTQPEFAQNPRMAKLVEGKRQGKNVIYSVAKGLSSHAGVTALKTMLAKLTG